MKHLGTGLFAIGVGLCAAFGAQLSQPMYEMKKEQGQLLSYELSTLKSKYEVALKNAEGKDASSHKIPADPLTKDYTSQSAYLTALIAQHDEYVASLKRHSDAKLDALRRSWLDARRSALAQKTKIAFLEKPGPNLRLASWVTDSGAGFGAGLFFIVIGALIARRVKKAELTGSGTESGSGSISAVNVRVMVTEVAEQVGGLAERVKENQSPTIACADEIRQEIERLALSHFQPIVDARYRLQAEIGLAAFAEAFGPFSAGERNVSRAWSALVDEHWPEAVASLANAATALRMADQKLS
ncbi:MAG: hypothetical protein VYA30_02445 [Myxococcota bacterium]|nr:hypothetical protein [Myxococcota bacterium]